MPNGLDERISISIYPPSTTGEILFNDCWRNDTFKTWFNTGSSGSSLMTVLLFMNEQDFIIHRKLIRIIYRKNR